MDNRKSLYYAWVFRLYVRNRLKMEIVCRVWGVSSLGLCSCFSYVLVNALETPWWNFVSESPVACWNSRKKGKIVKNKIVLGGCMIFSVTVKAVLLQWNWMLIIQQEMENDAIWSGRIHPYFILVTTLRRVVCPGRTVRNRNCHS